jgi:pimeloyl-ACP methyl ester carboxylesterase
MAERLADVRVVVVESAGHAVHMEAPERLVDELLRA